MLPTEHSVLMLRVITLELTPIFCSRRLLLVSTPDCATSPFFFLSFFIFLFFYEPFLLLRDPYIISHISDM